MKRMFARLGWMAAGLSFGLVGSALYLAAVKPVQAYNDRYEDFILCTGPVDNQINVPTDGVWLLDYRSGKLQGTLIDRIRGKIINWAEVDLVQEFGIPPKQNVHFMMTTGNVAVGQAALYVAETTTGRFGIYTMGPRPDGRSGLVIRRHDLTYFRQPPPGP
jgi:hypothetical protein